MRVLSQKALHQAGNPESSECKADIQQHLINTDPFRAERTFGEQDSDEDRSALPKYIKYLKGAHITAIKERKQVQGL